MNEVCYFDSSVLLSVILREENSRQAEALWQNSKHKVSSLICEAECLISLRRTQKTYPQKFSVTWLTQREKEIQNFLEQMTLKPFDKSIIEIIHQHHALANCRTLDAIHLATALLFKSNCQNSFKLLSFDQKMIETARKIKIT